VRERDPSHSKGCRAPVIRQVLSSRSPEAAAEMLTVMLALDRGYSSSVIARANGAYLVVASDGQAVLFVQSP
jgi:hypothetical protein